MWSGDKRPEHKIDVGTALVNMSGNAALDSSRNTKKKPEKLTIKVTKATVKGRSTFGLALSDQNRITSLPDGAAKKAGLKQFDLVTHVDGMELVGKISDHVTPQTEALMLTVSRPPQAMWVAISNFENEGGAVYGPSKVGAIDFDNVKREATPTPRSTTFLPGGKHATSPPPASGPGGPSMPPKASQVNARDSTIETNTVQLGKPEGGSFGLELNAASEVILVDLDSPAHKAGLKVGDLVTDCVFERFRKPLPSGPLFQVLPKLPAGQDVLITFDRGVNKSRPLSCTEHLTSAEL